MLLGLLAAGLRYAEALAVPISHTNKRGSSCRSQVLSGLAAADLGRVAAAANGTLSALPLWAFSTGPDYGRGLQFVQR